MKVSTDHYKIEAEIMNVWGIKDVISTFLWRYLDHPRPMTEDEVWNHVYAIECLLDLHCEKLMDEYCKYFELNQYAPPDVKALRDRMFGSEEVQKAIKEIKKQYKKPAKKAK